jgi:hypothetical protein
MRPLRHTDVVCLGVANGALTGGSYAGTGPVSLCDCEGHLLRGAQHRILNNYGSLSVHSRAYSSSYVDYGGAFTAFMGMVANKKSLDHMVRDGVTAHLEAVRPTPSSCEMRTIPPEFAPFPRHCGWLPGVNGPLSLSHS